MKEEFEFKNVDFPVLMDLCKKLILITPIISLLVSSYYYQMIFLVYPTLSTKLITIGDYFDKAADIFLPVLFISFLFLLLILVIIPSRLTELSKEKRNTIQSGIDLLEQTTKGQKEKIRAIEDSVLVRAKENPELLAAYSIKQIKEMVQNTRRDVVNLDDDTNLTQSLIDKSNSDLERLKVLQGKISTRLNLLLFPSVGLMLVLAFFLSPWIAIAFTPIYLIIFGLYAFVENTSLVNSSSKLFGLSVKDLTSYLVLTTAIAFAYICVFDIQQIQDKDGLFLDRVSNGYFSGGNYQMKYVDNESDVIINDYPRKWMIKPVICYLPLSSMDEVCRVFELAIPADKNHLTKQGKNK